MPEILIIFILLFAIPTLGLLFAWAFPRLWEAILDLCNSMGEVFIIKSPSKALAALPDPRCDPAYIEMMPFGITAKQATDAFSSMASVQEVHVRADIQPGLQIDGLDVAAELRELRKLVVPQRVLKKCRHCGQWAAVMTPCVHCGAPVDPE